MTLVEMMVALVITGLIFGVALSTIGPWMGHSRRLEHEAQFWAALDPGRQALDDLVGGGVDLDKARWDKDEGMTFRSLTPRLSAIPERVDLFVRDGKTLVVERGEHPARESILLSGGPPLRLRLIKAQPLQQKGLRPQSPQPMKPDALLVEAEFSDGWAPLIVTRFKTNAPLSCAFDVVSRQCR